ncbi:hypothetical protein L1887_23851 [Cichorium endivia]|nr:hypothetical protein L1887_23851 [Cichorium endivia]
MTSHLPAKRRLKSLCHPPRLVSSPPPFVSKHRQNEEDHRRLVTMVDKIKPYLRSVDNVSTHQVMFATYMSTCACILGEELAKSDEETTLFLCEKTILEFERLFMDDQLFGRSVCNSIISQLDQCIHGQKLLTCVLGALANQWKIGKKNLHLQFLKFVEECVIRRRGAVATVAKFLNIEADRFQKYKLQPICLILGAMRILEKIQSNNEVHLRSLSSYC